MQIFAETKKLSLFQRNDMSPYAFGFPPLLHVKKKKENHPSLEEEKNKKQITIEINSKTSSETV